jgi:hypothetical protein
MVDPDDPERSETVEKEVRIFGASENPEFWVKWRIDFNVIRNMPPTTAIAKTKMVVTLLKGRAKDFFPVGQSHEG